MIIVMMMVVMVWAVIMCIKGKWNLYCSLSDLYSDEEISVSVSGLFFCLTYTVLLATTIYYLNQIVCNFDLRRLFYSRQCFKSICYSSA